MLPHPAAHRAEESNASRSVLHCRRAWSLLAVDREHALQFELIIGLSVEVRGRKVASCSLPLKLIHRSGSRELRSIRCCAGHACVREANDTRASIENRRAMSRNLHGVPLAAGETLHGKGRRLILSKVTARSLCLGSRV